MLHSEGGKLTPVFINVQHPTGWCTAAILRQNPRIRLKWRERKHWANYTRGWLGGQMERASLGMFARTLGNPRLFVTSAMGSFMTTVSQDLGLASHPKDSISSSTVSLSRHWGQWGFCKDQKEDCPLLAHRHLFQGHYSFSKEVSHPSTNPQLISFSYSTDNENKK